MLSLRISRWRQPRMSWLAVILLAGGCLTFGLIASSLAAPLDTPIIAISSPQADQPGPTIR